MKTTENNVLVKEEPFDKMTVGGLFIPRIGTIPMALGTVVKLGPGKYNPFTKKLTPIELKVGDRVIYNPGVATEVTVSVKDEQGNISKLKLVKVAENECTCILDDNEEIK